MSRQCAPRAEKIPAISLAVDEHRDAPIRFVTRLPNELNAGGQHALVRGIKVLNPEKHPHTPGELIADGRFLSFAVSARNQDAGAGVWRPNDNPALWSAVIRQRCDILGELELKHVYKERNGALVVPNDQSEQIEVHMTVECGAPMNLSRAELHGEG